MATTNKAIPTDNKDILVPLTNSLYVKGKLSNPDRVIVDVGTGFYVEKASFPVLIVLHVTDWKRSGHQKCH